MHKSGTEVLTDYIEAIRYAEPRMRRINVGAWIATTIAVGMLSGIGIQEVASRNALSGDIESMAQADGFNVDDVAITSSTAPRTSGMLDFKDLDQSCELVISMQIGRDEQGIVDGITEYQVGGYVDDSPKSFVVANYGEFMAEVAAVDGRAPCPSPDYDPIRS